MWGSGDFKSVYKASSIESMSLFEDEFLFAAPPDHPLAQAKTLKVSQLAEESLLLLEDGHCLRDHALSVCGMSPQLPGEDTRSEFAATSLHTLVQMVRSGLGTTLLPKMAVDAGLAEHLDLTIRGFDPPVSGRAIGMVWRKGSARAEEAQMLGDFVKAQLV